MRDWRLRPTATRRSTTCWGASRGARHRGGPTKFRGVKARHQKTTVRQFSPASSSGRHYFPKAEDASPAEHPLVAGTAWLFARPEHDWRLRLPLRRRSRAGRRSRNRRDGRGARATSCWSAIRCSFAQPIQGTHPRESRHVGAPTPAAGPCDRAARARRSSSHETAAHASRPLPVHLRRGLRAAAPASRPAPRSNVISPIRDHHRSLRDCTVY